MKTILIFFIAIFCFHSSAKTSFTIINTGHAESLEMISISDGNFKKVRFNHAAFVIKHKEKTILFETGIGSNIHKEFKESMPFWARPIFHFTFIEGIKSQAPQLIYDHIILSHAHWDHAGGLTDNLGRRPLIGPDEIKEIQGNHIVHHRTFPIHFKDNHPISFQWTEKQYLEFEKHYDLFGDGVVILVPLPGHSYGSIGLILNGKKEKVFFVGDAIWLEKQLDLISHKALIPSYLVDRDKNKLTTSLEKIKRLRDKYKFRVVPTHDSKVHDTIGYYPLWTNL
ncbi:MBL fold metallo-hydrolase [Halobacteriovorax sp. GB3]|uniref:MBL fold metallo-hydrolase n=1 Tax=Halobacteriovorax sp. GB3 TaxID=2719615 RepID=UPI00235F06BE|nr:MBL fold metallo-hydrolase [Halobacteriovorax sp. GB3]MDD0852035.1 MBL fold metallo-hydrolase [Halobacteriovorax sp. GB3]